MTLQQAIRLIKFHRDWERVSEDGESPIMLISLDEAFDMVLRAAEQYLESPTQPEKDTEPTPEPFTPKEGDFLIAIDPCVIEGGRHDGMASLTVNNEYRVMEDFGWLIVVINDFAERHEFTLETIHKYFKRKE